MKSRGADGSNADFDSIIGYLGKYFGQDVNVNKAAAKDIQTLDLTAAQADAIIKARPAGGFKTLAELGKVPGIDMKSLEPLKDRIKFQ